MKNQKFTYAEYKKLKGFPLENKIMRAKQLIAFEIKSSKNPMVCCSWGKDSIVLLHLVRSICKKVLVLFHNTGVEYPETYEYRDEILKKWHIQNYIETKPIISFWDCVEKYDYPKFRQLASQGKQRTPKCCYYLKEKPAKDFIKKHKIDSQFLGLQASESMVRRLSFFREGEAFDSKTYKTRIVRPLMIWTNEDVWDYQKEFDIPYNKLYDKMKRNGCMPCTGFKNWREVLAKANPKMYSKISNDLGQPLLNDFDCREKR
jgi:phosphoadenosine phosphosulfate reductase